MKNIISNKLDDARLSAEIQDQLDHIVGDVGEALDLNKKLSECVVNVATAWATVLGTEPTFEEWTDQRAYIVEHVATSKGVTKVYVNDFMTKVVNWLKTEMELHKPQKDTKQAVLKDAKRQAERETLAKMSDDELQEGIDSNAENKQFKQADKLTAEVSRREKAEVKVQKEIAKDYFKDLATAQKDGLGTNVRHISGAIAYAKADDEMKNQICNLLGVSE